MTYVDHSIAYFLTAIIDANDNVDPSSIDLFESPNDFRTTNNISRVRIPSAIFVSTKYQKPNFDISPLFKNYRQQLGTHLVVRSCGLLGKFSTYVEPESNEYRASITNDINICYPHYLNVNYEHQMCIGLRFSNNFSQGFRTFNAIEGSSSCGVFDLMEDFLDPQLLKKGINSSFYRQMFPAGEKHYAIYLCAGAKLIVEDHLNEKASKDGSYVCRSLFQSGSLVIVSGKLKFITSSNFTSDGPNKSQELSSSIPWFDALKYLIIRPEDSLHQNWFVDRGLHKSKEQVIFLGHSYSLHDSVCWRLQVYRPEESTDGMSDIRLQAPEGGRIVDIQNWDYGMAEIYWRHRFERLYERVLYTTLDQSYRQKEHFKSWIPCIKGDNPHYWEKKILGVGINFNSWTFDYENMEKNYETDEQEINNRKKLEENSPRIPPFYEKYTDWVETVTPFAPPLHPPIYSKLQFFYLRFNCRPIYLSGQLVLIDDNLYVIKYKEGVDEYLWHKPMGMHQFWLKYKPPYSHSPNHRLGTDFRVYFRSHKLIGKKTLFYFERYHLEPNSALKCGQYSSKNPKQKKKKHNQKKQ